MSRFLGMRKKCHCMCCWCTKRDAIVNETSSFAVSLFLFLFLTPPRSINEKFEKNAHSTTPTIPFFLCCYAGFIATRCFSSTPRLLSPCLFAAMRRYQLWREEELFTPWILTFVTKKKIVCFAYTRRIWVWLIPKASCSLRVVWSLCFPKRRGYAYLHYMSFSNRICHGCMSSPSLMRVSIPTPCCSCSSQIGIRLEKRNKKLPKLLPEPKTPSWMLSSCNVLLDNIYAFLHVSLFLYLHITKVCALMLCCCWARPPFLFVDAHAFL